MTTTTTNPTETTIEGRYPVVWPRSPRAIELTPIVPRLKSLDGKRLAFAWNHRFRGGEIWELLKEGLSARFRGMTFVDWQELGNIHGGNEREVIAALPETFKRLGVDAFVAGMGC